MEFVVNNPHKRSVVEFLQEASIENQINPDLNNISAASTSTIAATTTKTNLEKCTTKKKGWKKYFNI